MRELTADTIIKVKQPLPLPRKCEPTGETRIRLSQIVDLKDWHNLILQDKHSNARLGEVRKWADGKLHEKTQHGWRELPGNWSKYKKGQRSKHNLSFTGYNKSHSERKEDLIRSKPVKISTIDYKGKTEKECKAIAKQKYQSISNKTKIQPINKDGMKIECPMAGFRETTQHIADKKVLYALGEIDTLINNATFMFEEKNSDPRKTNTLNMLNYAAKATFDNEDYYVRILIREDKDGNFYYDNDNTEVEKIKAYPRLNTAPNAGHHENTPHMNRINQWLAGVKLKVNNKHDK